MLVPTELRNWIWWYMAKLRYWLKHDWSNLAELRTFHHNMHSQRRFPVFTFWQFPPCCFWNRKTVRLTMKSRLATLPDALIKGLCHPMRGNWKMKGINLSIARPCSNKFLFWLIRYLAFHFWQMRYLYSIDIFYDVSLQSCCGLTVYGKLSKCLRCKIFQHLTNLQMITLQEKYI